MVTLTNNSSSHITTRVGLPMSFVYCTLDQGIWTKDPERLIEEQKDVWGRTLNQTVYYYHKIVPTDSDKSDSKSKKSKFEMPEKTFLKKKWNCAVGSSFSSMERFLGEPHKPIFGLYNKIISYTNEPAKSEKKETE
ncbi:hypothetical protein GZH46_01688, partial [Fragariocoptes setiger]